METNRRVEVFQPVYVETISDPLETGKLYISQKYGVAIHLCACGCGGKTVMDFKPFWEHGWDYEDDAGEITFMPSIGNMSFCPQSGSLLHTSQPCGLGIAKPTLKPEVG